MVIEYPIDARTTHRYLVQIAIGYSPMPNGLRASKDGKEHNRIEDQVEKAMLPYGGILIGHSIFRGQFEMVFMTRQVPPATLEVKSGLFRKRQLTLKVTEDPDWGWVDEHMTLSGEEIEMHQNRMLIEQLQSQGDRIEAIRPVDFAFVFQNTEDRSAFIRASEAFGYRVGMKGEPSSEDGSLWLELVADTPVDESSMASRCSHLRKLVAEFNGDFDGWATPVVK